MTRCKYAKCNTHRPPTPYELEMGWHVPCLNAKHKTDRNTRVSYTGKPEAELSAQSAYARTYYREHLADKKKAERKQKRAKVTG